MTFGNATVRAHGDLKLQREVEKIAGAASNQWHETGAVQMTHYAAKSEFQDCVKKLALKLKGIYCMIDHQADVSINNVVMFVKLLSVFVIDGKDQVLRNVAKHEILQHLRSFENEFRQYFPIGDDDVESYGRFLTWGGYDDVQLLVARGVVNRYGCCETAAKQVYNADFQHEPPNHIEVGLLAQIVKNVEWRKSSSFRYVAKTWSHH
ncbi:hypothetical protein T08_3841 [Trichinella sp. T8]|nr:hypothetical protein T08_3841 [Trichinella sp. T8]